MIVYYEIYFTILFRNINISTRPDFREAILLFTSCPAFEKILSLGTDVAGTANTAQLIDGKPMLTFFNFHGKISWNV